MANLGPDFIVDWALTDWPPAYDLASPLMAARIAFLLAARLLIEATASRFIGVGMAADGLVANTDLIGNLDGAPPL